MPCERASPTLSAQSPSCKHHQSLQTHTKRRKRIPSICDATDQPHPCITPSDNCCGVKPMTAFQGIQGQKSTCCKQPPSNVTLHHAQPQGGIDLDAVHHHVEFRHKCPCGSLDQQHHGRQAQENSQKRFHCCTISFASRNRLPTTNKLPPTQTTSSGRATWSAWRYASSTRSKHPPDSPN